MIPSPKPRALMIITAAAAAVVLAAGVPASAEPAVGQIVNAGGPTAVAGEYIVVFDDAAVAKADVATAALSHGGRARREDHVHVRLRVARVRRQGRRQGRCPHGGGRHRSRTSSRARP